MSTFNDYVVVVYTGGRPIIMPFKDEKKARDCYAECLLKYPTKNVELIIP